MPCGSPASLPGNPTGPPPLAGVAPPSPVGSPALGELPPRPSPLLPFAGATSLPAPELPRGALTSPSAHATMVQHEQATATILFMEPPACRRRACLLGVLTNAERLTLVDPVGSD